MYSFILTDDRLCIKLEDNHSSPWANRSPAPPSQPGEKQNFYLLRYCQTSTICSWFAQVLSWQQVTEPH